MRDQLKRLLSESAVWMAANLVSTGVALAVAYAIAAVGAGGQAALVVALAIAGGISLTWGSWISLVWTRSRPLRAAMKGITLIPGLVLLGAGGFGFYVGLGSILWWLVLIASAVGTLASSVLLWQQMPRAAARRSPDNMAVGFIVYPVLTALGAAVVGWLWFSFISEPLLADWRELLNMATVVVTVLAVELTTTALPASFSMMASRADGFWTE